MSFTITQQKPMGEINEWNPDWANDMDSKIEKSILEKNNAERKTHSTPILKKDSIITYSDYNDLVLSKGKDRLREMEKNEFLKTKSFMDLSLNEIFNNTILTVVAVFVDFINLFDSGKTENKTLKEKVMMYSDIILEKNRIIYVGIFFIFLSIMFMTVFLSS